MSGALPEKGMSDSDLRHHNENMGTLKNWLRNRESSCRLLKNWKMSSVGEKMPIREDEGFDHALDHQIESGGELHL